MEEIARIAQIYYKACIDFKLFGYKGAIFVTLGFPFLIFSIFITLNFNQLKIGFEILVIIPQLIGMLLWVKAKKIYDKNLIKRLKVMTLSTTNDLRTQKVLYLSNLTSQIGSDFFDVLKNVIDIQKIYNKNRSFSPNNFGYYFLEFIYDPDSKNRILSLLIYLISLIALLTVVKLDNIDYVYSMIEQITFMEILTFFGWSAFFIAFFYIIFIAPIMMAFGYIISPIMRSFSNQRFLIGYLISELSNLAFSDQYLATNSTKGRQQRTV